MSNNKIPVVRRNEKIQVSDILSLIEDARKSKDVILYAKCSAVLQRRIDHCYDQLIKGIRNSQRTTIDHEVVLFEGGHFSLPTYNAMIDEIENRRPEEYSAAVWLQIVKQLYYEKNENDELFEFTISNMLLSSFKEK